MLTECVTHIIAISIAIFALPWFCVSDMFLARNTSHVHNFCPVTYTKHCSKSLFDAEQ